MFLPICDKNILVILFIEDDIAFQGFFLKKKNKNKKNNKALLSKFLYQILINTFMKFRKTTVSC